METPLLIYFKEGTLISAVVYQKFNGSLAGVGRVLASFLKEVMMTRHPPNYDKDDI